LRQLWITRAGGPCPPSHNAAEAEWAKWIFFYGTMTSEVNVRNGILARETRRSACGHKLAFSDVASALHSATLEPNGSPECRRSHLLLKQRDHGDGFASTGATTPTAHQGGDRGIWP
jgi:hypothetical protein